MKIKKQSTVSTKKIILACLLFVTAAILSYGAFAKINHSWPFGNPSQENTPVRPVNSVDYGPPSEQETNNSQNAKEQIIKGEAQEDNNNQDNTLKTATVTVSYADIYNDNLEIRAFTPSVIEGTGECTATISRSGYESIIKKSDAFVDASSSICKPIYIPKSQLANGKWSIDITYKSPTYAGSSGEIEVEVK